MPRLLPATTPFDTLEDEVLFTTAAIEADPDSQDLLPLAANWMDRIDEVRIKDRGVRAAAAKADATRQVADSRLDTACTRFGDELLLAVNKDRESSRWVQFFRMAVSRFVRQALASQVLTVQGWLTSTDPVLLAHRTGLERWVTAADTALIRDRTLAVTRGENWQRREELCRGLTRERDGLHAALVDRAGERNLDRSWPDVFFRTTRRPDAPPPPIVEPVPDVD